MENFKKINIYIYPKEEIYFDFFTKFGNHKIQKDKHYLLSFLKLIKNYKIKKSSQNPEIDNYNNINGLKYEINNNKNIIKLYFLERKTKQGWLGFNNIINEYRVNNNDNIVFYAKESKFLNITEEDMNNYGISKPETPKIEPAQQQIEGNIKAINNGVPDEQEETDDTDEQEDNDDGLMKKPKPLTPKLELEQVPPLLKSPPLDKAGKKRKTHKRKHNKKRRKTTKKR